MLPILICLLVGLCAPAISPTPVVAGTLERLVMPGPVIGGHAKYENDCEQCHQPFRKAEQRSKCLDCHKPVAVDILENTGFHGRHPDVARFDCKHCHTDHKGRDATIVLLDTETFDHEITDYRLQGSHQQAACGTCHRHGVKHRDTPKKCSDCHKASDPHRGNLGQDCAVCHSEQSWKDERFDHTKTRFPLVGRHVKTPCSACHPSGTYDKPTPATCYGCHIINDVHGGRYGDKCQTCHTAKEWKKPQFNHDKTKYPLLGKHREVRCDLCHLGKIYQEKLGHDCLTCHRVDDVHKARYGEKCGECHTQEGWKKSTFDHAKTRYPLQGKHQNAPCDTCHPGRLQGEPPGTDCGSCHLLDDRHKGRYGLKCGTCHTQEGWGKQNFDHAQTRYPLRGQHLQARCEACHQQPSYAQDLPTECQGCHQQDDIHRGRVGLTCQTCHTEQAWKPAVFDHDKTRYPLLDKHREVACDRCHLTDPDKPKPGTKCVDCHEHRDVHKGQEGRNCENCHNQRGWASDVLFDHDLTRLPLLGMHAVAPCEACHLTSSYKDASVRCVDCHAKDDVHRQSLGENCADCHTPNGWSLWRFDHATQTRFPLLGAHEELECKACHREPVQSNVRLASSCSSCHSRDDAHRGRFGPACDRCHSAKSFKELTRIH